MSADRIIYRFGNFELNPSESSLLRSGSAVPITPKALRLLAILTENQGHVLDKSYLLDQIWEDSHVEEGNLTFNIRQLRKILGDEVKHPKYIETVPKRGYRFIAEVEKSEQATAETPLWSDVQDSSIDSQWREEKRLKWLIRPLAIPLILVLVAAATVGKLYGPFAVAGNSGKIFSEPFSIESLSTDGNVAHAVLSGSGDLIVYVSGKPTDKQSLWYRELASGHSREILPESELQILGVDLAADDKTIYFVRIEELGRKPACMYRTNILGAVPERLHCNIEGWFDISSDGQTISFVRCPYDSENYCSLFVSDVSGQNERVLLTLPAPIRIEDNAISPDGTNVAFASGQTLDGSNDFTIQLIDINSLEVSETSDETFGQVGRLDWVPNGESLLATARKSSDETRYLWHIEPRSNRATPINNYDRNLGAVSFSADGSKMISTTTFGDFRLASYKMNGDELPIDLGRGLTPSFTQNGKVLAASDRSGNTSIWSFDPNGLNANQQSFGPLDYHPISSIDGARIVFNSGRSNRHEIWTARSDRSDLQMIASAQGGFPLAISPDNSTIYFISALSRNLWRIGIDGTNEEEVYDRPLRSPAISKDAEKLAFYEVIDGVDFVTVLSIAERTLINRFRLPGPAPMGRHIAWSGNDRNLMLVLKESGQHTFSVWRLGSDTMHAEFVRDLGTKELGERSAFAVSPDEHHFVVALGSWKHDVVLIKGLN